MGKKRLDRAIELYKRVIPNGKHDIFHITWHAYYLANNKSSPAVLSGAVPTDNTTTANLACDANTQTCTAITTESPSIPIQEAITRRFGGSTSTATALQARLKAKGRSDGIEFSFGSRIGSSRDAHRLIYLAGVKDREARDLPEKEGGGDDGSETESGYGSIQNAMIDELFKRYFEQDGDITSRDMLVEVGEKAGLDPGEVREWLVSGKGRDVVDKEAEEAVSRDGIMGVPVVFINGGVRIDGAQDVEDFFMEFVKVRESVSGELGGTE